MPSRTLLTLLLLAALAGVVPAQLQGFDLLDWSPTGSLTGGSFVTPGVLQVEGPDGGLPCAGGAQAGFSAVVPVSGLVQVQLHWNSAAPCSGDLPFYALDGLVVSLADGGLGCTQPGQHPLAFEVQAGQLLTFGVSSSDCLGGPGLASFDQFQLTPQQWVDLGGGLDPRQQLALEGGPGFGQVLAPVPEVDGGLTAVAVTTPGAGSGRVSLHTTTNGQQLWTRIQPGAFGQALVGLDDVSGDGRGDLAVGSPDLGRVDLLSGLDGAPLWQHPGDPTLRTGAALTRLTDLSGDFRDELVVGQPGDGLVPSGPVLILSGLDGALLQSLPPQPGELAFGAALANAGDVDGDGEDDLLVGAPGDGTSPPRARVVSGLTGLTLHTLVPPSGQLDSAFGAALAGAGDVDGDGHHELLVGAPADRKTPAGPRLGSVTLFDGQTGQPLQTWWGSADGERFGQALSGGFDVDADGSLDGLIGAPGSDLPWKAAAGSAQVLRLTDGATVAWFGGDGGQALGTSLAFLGDGGGGRLPGVLVGKPGAATGGQLVQFGDLSHLVGAPTLTGEGTQAPGAPFQVTVSGALPFTSVALVVGLAQLQAPFKGGTLVPTPDLLVFLGSDGAGSLALPSLWPTNLPLAAPLVLQAWCQDGLAHAGWSATNGLATIVP